MNSYKQAYSTAADPMPGSAHSYKRGTVFAAFRASGTTAREWALAHNWPPRSVYEVIKSWIEHPQRRGKTPLGGRYEAIAREMQAALGPDVVPLPEPHARTLERVA